MATIRSSGFGVCSWGLGFGASGVEGWVLVFPTLAPERVHHRSSKAL